MQPDTSKTPKRADRRPRRIRSLVLLAAIGSAVIAYLIAATAVAATSKTKVHTAAGQTETKTWNGKNGAGYADQTSCPSSGGAYWLFILTPGGGRITSGTLDVTFKSGATTTSTGYHPGKGSGAMHFDVTSTQPDAIKSATATFTYVGGSVSRVVLTISHAYCAPGSGGSSSVPVTQPASTPVTGSSTS
jgi:hypothetical protein